VDELSKGGNGCDDTLMWWVTDYLDPPKPVKKPVKPTKREKTPREFTMADLPKQCKDVLSSP
jgi:penicillin-insensitive murein DD-endopeptidase